MATLQRSMRRLASSAIQGVTSKTRPSGSRFSPNLQSHFSRSLSSSSPPTWNSFNRPQILQNDVISSRSFDMILTSRWTEFHRYPAAGNYGTNFSRAYSSKTSAYDQNEWALKKAVSDAIEVAIANKQRVVEPEHLMKAIIDENSFATSRILNEARIHPESVAQFVDDFISQQPKVTGDIISSRILVGSDLKSLMENAKKCMEDMEDELISVEHFLMAFHSDRCFGQPLYHKLGLTDKDLMKAVNAVRAGASATQTGGLNRGLVLELFFWLILLAIVHYKESHL